MANTQINKIFVHCIEIVHIRMNIIEINFKLLTSYSCTSRGMKTLLVLCVCLGGVCVLCLGGVCVCCV